MRVMVETFWGLILGCWKWPEPAENRPFVGLQVAFLGIFCLKSAFLTLKGRTYPSLRSMGGKEVGLVFCDCRGAFVHVSLLWVAAASLVVAAAAAAASLVVATAAAAAIAVAAAAAAVASASSIQLYLKRCRWDYDLHEIMISENWTKNAKKHYFFANPHLNEHSSWRKAFSRKHNGILQNLGLKRSGHKGVPHAKKRDFLIIPRQHSHFNCRNRTRKNDVLLIIIPRQQSRKMSFSSIKFSHDQSNCDESQKSRLHSVQKSILTAQKRSNCKP